MRILHLIHSLAPRSGGPSHALRGMVRHQTTIGHEVEVLATDVQSTDRWDSLNQYRQSIQSDAAFRGAKLTMVAAVGRRGLSRRFAWSAQTVPWLRTRLRSSTRPIDVVHIHGSFSHITAMAGSVSKSERVPYIVRATGSFSKSCVEMRSAWLKRLYLAYTRHTLESAYCIHLTSQAEAEQLHSSLSGTQVRVMPIGVEVPGINSAASRERLWRAWPSLRGRRLVLFLGRLHKIKRPCLVAQAVAHLAQHSFNRERLALLYCGSDDGGEVEIRSLVERLGLQDVALFTGFVEGAMKHDVLAGADVLVLPSIHENYGVAVVEALAHGTPAVVSSGVAAKTFVESSGGGRVVDATLEAVAGGIRDVLESDSVALGGLGRRFVDENLGWPAVVRQYDQMYIEAISAKYRSPANATSAG